MARDVKVSIVGDTRGLKRAFDKAEGDARGFGSSMEKTARKVGDAFKVVGPMAAAGLAAFGVYAVKTASDSAESFNAMGLAFGDSADAVDAFGDSAAESMGLSKAAFREAAAGVGTLLNSFGVADDAAGKMSLELLQRAADIGSAFNASTEDVVVAMQGALTGEMQMMKPFGVVMDEQALKLKALEMGFGDVSGAANLAGRAQVIAALMMEGSNAVAGDFGNTLGESLPNQIKVAQAKFANLAEQIGVVLMPIALWAMGKILEALESLTAWWDEGGKQYLEDFKNGLQILSDWWETDGSVWLADFKTGLDEVTVKSGELYDSLFKTEEGDESFVQRVNDHFIEAGWSMENFERGLGDVKTGWADLVTFFPIGARMVGDALHDVFIKGVYQSVLVPVGRAIWFVMKSIADGIMVVVRSIAGAISWIIDRLGDLGSAASAVWGGAASGFNGLVNGIGSLGERVPHFADGGIIPGPRGAPQLVMAHGGETVLPTHKQDISNFTGGGGGDVGGDVYLDGDKVGRWMSNWMRDDRRAR